MNTFKVNGKTYTAQPFNFNTVCNLEDMGISLEEAENKPLSMLRAYFALCVGGNLEYAGHEIEEDIKNGGTVDQIMTAMTKEMDESDFFQALNKSEETDATPSKTAKK